VGKKNTIAAALDNTVYPTSTFDNITLYIQLYINLSDETLMTFTQSVQLVGPYRHNCVHQVTVSLQNGNLDSHQYNPECLQGLSRRPRASYPPRLVRSDGPARTLVQRQAEYSVDTRDCGYPDGFLCG